MTTYVSAEALNGMNLEGLQNQYDLFIAETGLPKMSADELQAEIAGTGRTKEFNWLGHFVAAWMEAQSAERETRRLSR